MEDIATPGINEVTAHDYADFLMEYFGGDWEGIDFFLGRLEGQKSSAGSSRPPGDPATPPQGGSSRGDLAEIPNLEEFNPEQENTIPELLERVEQLARDRQNEEALNEVYLLAGRFQFLDKNRGQGTITDSDVGRQEEQISMSLKKLGSNLLEEKR